MMPRIMIRGVYTVVFILIAKVGFGEMLGDD